MSALAVKHINQTHCQQHMRSIVISMIVLLLFVPLVSAKLPYNTLFWQAKYDSIANDFRIVITPPYLALDIWELAFVTQGINGSKNTERVYINMSKTSLPTAYKPFTAYYGAWVLNNTIGGIGQVTELNMTYRVPYAWLDEQKISADKISLYFYNGTDSVQELPTLFLRNYSGGYGDVAKMQSQLPSFGLFVVAEKGKTLHELAPILNSTQNSTNTSQTNQTVNNATINTTNVIINTTASSVFCTEVWLCTDWTNCTIETQTRKCTDKNNCGTKNNMPELNASCAEPQTTSAQNQTNATAVSLIETYKTSWLNQTSKMYESIKKKTLDIIEKAPLWTKYTLSAVLALLVLMLVCRPCVKKLFKAVHHKKLDREFDRRVDALWQRRQEEEKATPTRKKKKENTKEEPKQEFFTGPETSGRDLPGMPPKR